MQLLRIPTCRGALGRHLSSRWAPSAKTWAKSGSFHQRRWKSSESSKPYYVTTPIFYVNASPHVGHAHSMILADVFKRFQTLRSRRAILCTGTDEHGMKVQRSALKAGQPPGAFCDANAQKFRDVAESLSLSEHDFIRTTDEHHVAAVQEFWRELRDRDLIYETTHRGWYSVSDECFYPESMIQRVFEPATGKVVFSATESGSVVEWVEESNYHFRMTAFKDDLLKFYADNPEWIVPSHKMKEVVSWVENHLEDLSVSRPASRLSWGIPVPDDPSQTVYVWVDALVNYLSNLGYPAWKGGSMRASGWPADVQIIGKDILRFHGVYWPALLLALDIPPPQRLLTHAHWTIGGRKISKSLGNGVSPIFAADRFGADTIRFFLMRKGAIRDDSIFENSEVAKVYRVDLMGTFGNLMSRVTKSEKWSVQEAVKAETAAATPGPCPMGLETLRDDVAGEMDALRPDKALAVIMDSLKEGNKYIVASEPWNLPANLNFVIFTLSEALRISSILLLPYMPDRATEALDRLGVAAERRTFEYAVKGADDSYGAKPEGVVDARGREASLFPPLPSQEFKPEDGEPLVLEREAKREAKKAAQREKREKRREKRQVEREDQNGEQQEETK
ncbi:related to METHIONYL-TRNA SYNTHETASE, mitochondrial [Cephalotrichum gorgonifer]|uniref:Probable methionine--tRNA ligase, mitochondrial n=1 Tax=Cephalotrichum gorgonifer TaxID=2041049 RepID=A0AAE8MSW2_9PEZI|nr:related to METHIONYL-TRNA SYNTHETASE, mitochondrial [Cephalotrichum gorgonifer]